MSSDEISLATKTRAAKQQLMTVTKNVINLYAAPDTSSEVVSQALLNAELVSEETAEGFCYVQGADRYKGWADFRHLSAQKNCDEQSAIDPSMLERVTLRSLFADVYIEPDSASEKLSKLVISTKVMVNKSKSQNSFTPIEIPGTINVGWIKTIETEYRCSNVLAGWSSLKNDRRLSAVEKLGRNVLQNAELFIGVPYLWGGCTPFGIDCSGLVQVCYELEGLTLLRDADLQYGDKRFEKIQIGKSLSDSDFMAGDLLVFGTASSITHIGIASNDRRFIHASGRQRNFGTYYDSCSDSDWGEKYLGAVRLSIESDLSIESA